MKKRFCILSIMVFLCSVLFYAAGMEAHAKDNDFVIEAQMLPTDEPIYCIQLTVENVGSDWEGTVRLMVNSGYGVSANCVYDTALSLPQGSTKQFEVRLPKEGIERTDGYVTVRLLDAKGKKSAEKNFSRLLQNSGDAVPLGILSDAYASLTYLDMGGEEIYFGNRNRPMKLTQLSQDNLLSSLDTTAFLVIDAYDTKVLTDEEKEELEHWVYNGGILIVGTGDNAEKTLGGLDFLNIQYGELDGTKEDVFDWNYYVDTSQLSFVELEETGYTSFDMRELGLATSWGDGAVMILPCALTEVGKLGTDAYDEDYEMTQEDLVGHIYEDVSVLSESRYQWGNQAYESDYNLQRIFPILGKGSNRLKFGGLKAIVIIYVIFVGPVLYLILRALKKRDFYWIGVPVTTLIGIFLIYWAGRGFVVASTNVYSVTVQNLSKNESAATYLRCYDAGHKEWRLQLAEGYTYAGPLINGYYYSDDAENGNYYHRIYKEGERLSIGLNPKAGFEDGFFLAGAKKVTAPGTISWDGNKTITNETQWDFPYIAVIVNDHLMIYKNLAAGQSLSLEESACEFVDSVDTAVSSYGRYSSAYTPGEAYFYGYLRDSLREDEKVDIDLKAALGMGVSAAFPAQAGADKVLIIGVVENWDKAVDDDCSEVSYGCVYTVVEEKNAIH